MADGFSLNHLRPTQYLDDAFLKQPFKPSGRTDDLSGFFKQPFRPSDPDVHRDEFGPLLKQPFKPTGPSGQPGGSVPAVPFIPSPSTGGMVAGGVLSALGRIAPRLGRMIPYLNALLLAKDFYDWWNEYYAPRDDSFSALDWVAPAGWTKCPTPAPSCTAAITHWWWSAGTTCALFGGGCAESQAHAGVAPGTGHATARRLLLVSDTNYNGLGALRAQFIRNAATNTNYPYLKPAVTAISAAKPIDVIPALEPMRLPILARAPDPKPIPLSWAPSVRDYANEEDPRKRVLPKVATEPEADPRKRPWLRPGVAPFPSSVPAIIVGGGGKPPFDGWHGMWPPKKEEKKPRYRGKFGAMLFWVTNVMTEGADIIDAFYWALPLWARKKCGMYLSPAGKAACAVNYMSGLSASGNWAGYLDNVIENAVLNEIGDRVIGSLIAGANRGLLAAGWQRPVGYSAGNFDSPPSVDGDWHRSPDGWTHDVL